MVLWIEHVHKKYLYIAALVVNYGISNTVVLEIPYSLPLRQRYTVKCRYHAVLGVQEIDRVIAVTAL